MKAPRTFRLSHKAQADLLGIYRYLAAEDIRVAERVNADISKKIEWLVATGFDGSPRDRLLKGLRMTRAGSYGIYFIVSDDVVVVQRILHGSRDIRAEMFKGSSR